MSSSFPVDVIRTVPIQDQKPGTSGVRKKASLVESTPFFVENIVQSTFNTEYVRNRNKGSGSGQPLDTLVIGGDGRYLNREALQAIIKLAAGNGVRHVIVGQNGLLSTPALSSMIRSNPRVFGGFILTASHNPGGPHGDFGIKYNIESGAPAPESLTSAIHKETMRINEFRLAKLPDIDVSIVHKEEFFGGAFSVDVVDSVDQYLTMLRDVFDFDTIRSFLHRDGVAVVFDAMHGVTGPYIRRIFGDVLGIRDPKENLMHDVPMIDFGGGHPDPNLAHTHALQHRLGIGTTHDASSSTSQDSLPILGVAFDGDGDRNIVFGSRFFVNPSDSVAVIALHGGACIPYFKKHPINGVARSMPTSTALDRVASHLGIPVFETPTGWKFFGNLMDAGKIALCGEESFGTGSTHIREKDGIWAALAWLSILAHRSTSDQIATVQSIVEDMWKTHGRSLYMRFDYEELPMEDGELLLEKLRSQYNGTTLHIPALGEALCDEFAYVDPVDHSQSLAQGIRITAKNNSFRMIYRLSGTGSSGATIRVYGERVLSDWEPMSLEKEEHLILEVMHAAVKIAQIQELTGRDKPSVAT